MDARLVVLTDLGIVAKKTLDGSREVFVQSLAGGTPVAARARCACWRATARPDRSRHRCDGPRLTAAGWIRAREIAGGDQHDRRR
ncbi:MAG: hypothetical protein IPK27_13660 [Rhodanobacteraceae bacterium]|nr:hypothetical protein [Rhodanobacteraceae bacterium]